MKMRYVALPGEITVWRQQFAAYPEQEQRAYIRMLAHVVGDCPVCEGPVRRCDPRVLAWNGFRHLRCTGGGS